jgi:hypothetical protein
VGRSWLSGQLQKNSSVWNIHIFVQMLKHLYLLSISLAVLLPTGAQNSYKPLILQPYVGAAMPLHSGAFGPGIQGGLKYTPNTVIPVYLGLDGIILHSKVKSTWPDVGSYRYNTSSTFFSMNLGLHFLKNRRTSFDMGISWDFLHSTGRLETDNATLRNFLLDKYDHRNQSISGFLHINGKINNAISAFLRVSLHDKQYTNNQWILGCGLAYNIYNSTL